MENEPESPIPRPIKLGKGGALDIPCAPQATGSRAATRSQESGVRMALMQPCSADLPFKVCGFERWVVPHGRFKAAESKSDSARHGSSDRESQKMRTKFSFR